MGVSVGEVAALGEWLGGAVRPLLESHIWLGQWAMQFVGEAFHPGNDEELFEFYMALLLVRRRSGHVWG
jgi:hypothetical protein